MKYAFDGFISKMDTTEEGISELEDMTIENSTDEKQREHRLQKNKTEYTGTVGQLQSKPHHDTVLLKTFKWPPII